MLRLIQTAGHDTGRTMTFDKEVVRIGRMPDGDVVFDAHRDIDASGRHAELRREGETLVVVDVGSRNGTFVDGRRVDRGAVGVGSEIEFGRGGPKLRVDAYAPRGGTLPATPVGEVSQPQSTEPMAFSSLPQGAQSSGSGAAVPQRALENAAPVPAQGTASDPEKRSGPASAAVLRWVVLVAGLSAGLLGLLLVGIAWWTFQSRDAGDAPGAAREASSVVRSFAVANQPFGRCVSFPVAENLLATTASCVVGLEQAQQGGAFVTLEGAENPPVRIVRFWRHPDSQRGVDIGLVQVDPAELQPMDLSGFEEAGLDGSSELFAASPGVVGPLTLRFDGPAGIAHWERQQPVTDGAPVFAEDGSLIGMTFGIAQAGAGVQDAASIAALVAGLAAIAPAQ